VHAQQTSPSFFGRTLRKTIRAATVGLASFGLVASVAAAESRSATGLIDDNAYESPTYGYALEWSDDWTVSEEDTTSERGIDVLVLNGPASQFVVMSIPTDYDGEGLIEVFTEGMAGTEGLEILEEGEADGAVYQVVQFESEQDGTLIAYVEAAEIEAAGSPSEPAVVRLTSLLAKEAVYEDRLDAAVEEIELDGDSALRTLAGENSSDDADRDDTDREDADAPRRGRAGEEVTRGDSSGDDEDERGSREDRSDEDEDEDDRSA
jgi:hypothetical protein